MTSADAHSIISDKVVYYVRKELKKKLIPIVVAVVVLAVLIPILVLNLRPGAESAENSLIAEVMVVAEDAYGKEIELVHPGEKWRVTKGGSIVAEISVNLERAVVQTEDGEYYLSFATGDTRWQKMISGTKITVSISSKALAETIRDADIPPLAAMLNGRGWIALTTPEKRENIQDVLDWEPELKTGRSVDQIVAMLDAFYSDITNREASTSDALEELLLD